jgi:hypothetical protein
MSYQAALRNNNDDQAQLYVFLSPVVPYNGCMKPRQPVGQSRIPAQGEGRNLSTSQSVVKIQGIWIDILALANAQSARLKAGMGAILGLPRVQSEVSCNVG